MRGRGNNNSGGNNNNRRGPNPLTRNYESNGPDVKIRGSAQQIAEKYANLARDAQSSGDRVMAENYLQHAEHYNRITAAAQAQMPQQQNREQRDFSDDDSDDRDEAEMSSSSDNQSQSENQRQSGNDGSGPQPVIEGVPVEVQQEVMNREDGGQGRRANGAQEGGGDETEDNAPRRARRPRRSRSRSQENAEGQDGSPENAASENEAGEVTAPAAAE